MAVCKFCGLEDLEWMYDTSTKPFKYRLYSRNSGMWHLCTPTKEQRDTFIAQKEEKNPYQCKHLTPKNTYCQECENERAQDIDIAKATGKWREND